MSWRWRLETADGTAGPDVPMPAHQSQSDAESWLGENWRQLRESGVAAVSLFDGEREIYGPMPLSDD